MVHVLGRGRDRDRVRRRLLSRAPGAVVALAFRLLPVVARIAVLKYHLYDIDLLINRTLVYGSLTAVLPAVYVGGVVGVGGVVRRLSRQENNSLVVAGSTLAVAGSSVLLVSASRTSSIGASTDVDTTRRRPSTSSRRGCAIRSISMP